MNLSGTQLKDTYGNLVTTGTSAGSPTTGGLQNGDGSLLTSVGIGTNSPSVILEVKDNNPQIQLTDSVNASAYSRILNTDSGTLYIDADLGNAGSNSAILFRLDGGNEKMRIEGGGDISFRDTSANEAFYWDASTARLGIGTTSPSAPLSIDTGTTGTLAQFRGADTDILNIDADSNAIVLDARNVAYLGFEIQGSEAMRIDSSGNVMVGTTDTAPGVADTNVGVSLNSGRVFASAEGDYALNLNRNTSDGDIVRFRKDGTTIGTIGTIAGDLTIGDADVGIRFDTGTGLVPWNLSTNASTDNAIDIGASSARFKDLYLGGNANVDNFVIIDTGAVAANPRLYFRHDDINDTNFIEVDRGTNAMEFWNNGSERMRILSGGGLTFNGDTATANALDDYEEGTWTPAYTMSGTDFTSVTYDTGFIGGKYTKIGDLVHIQGAIMTDAITVGSASGVVTITGLPFAIGSITNGRDGFISGSIGAATDFAGDHPVTLYGGANDSKIILMTRNTANGATDNLQVSDLDTGANKNLIYFSATYKS